MFRCLVVAVISLLFGITAIEFAAWMIIDAIGFVAVGPFGAVDDRPVEELLERVGIACGRSGGDRSEAPGCCRRQ